MIIDEKEKFNNIIDGLVAFFVFLFVFGSCMGVIVGIIKIAIELYKKIL